VAVVMGLALVLLRTPELTDALRAPVLDRLVRSTSWIGPREP
jgi:hypothetical protein